jgi:hypothetical protein
MIEMAEIFRQHKEEYLSKYGDRILPSHRKAIDDIIACRTPALGGKVYTCSCGKTERYSYHSCGNRHCPKCGNDNATLWVGKQVTRIPAVPCFLIGFTLPHELNRIIRSNQKECYSLLFRASSVTEEASYTAEKVINCAGSYAREVGAMVGVDLPVYPDMHEAGITEPVSRFFNPMVVDISRSEGSANYYFYQYSTGQVVFCITPDPLLLGRGREETSVFLPQVAARMVKLYPRLANLKVRRTWRGCYPQTPDGTPVIGQVGPEGFYAAAGMCGQGFMLGPGVGEVMARLITGESTEEDRMVLNSMRLDRAFAGVEALK